MRPILLLLCLIYSNSLFANTNVWQGMPIVEFSLKDQHGQLREQHEFTDKWLVLYFYPKDKTPGCTVEAQNFSDDYPQYQALGTEIVGVSYDDVESHLDFAETYNIPFPLLADTDATLSKALKVDRILPWPHASRQTFIINPNGIIVKHFDSVDPDSHSRQLIKALRSLQTQDKG